MTLPPATRPLPHATSAQLGAGLAVRVCIDVSAVAAQLCSSANGFTTAGPTVIAEVHVFLIAEGVHFPPRWAGSPAVSASPPTIPSRVKTVLLRRGAGSAYGVS